MNILKINWLIEGRRRAGREERLWGGGGRRVGRARQRHLPQEAAEEDAVNNEVQIAGGCRQTWTGQAYVQGEHSGRLQPPVDLVPMVLAASLPLLQQHTAQVSWRNIPNPGQREVVTVQNGHPVQVTSCLLVCRMTHANGKDFPLTSVWRVRSWWDATVFIFTNCLVRW